MERKIAFIGTGGMFSKIVLEELLKYDISIKLVIMNIKEDSNKIPLSIELCKKASIEYIITNNINSIEVANRLKEHKIELACVCSLHQIIKPEIYTIPKNGMINLHPSYLPYYQGPNPWFWMIKDDEDIFGVSLHFITKDIDRGRIICREKMNLRNVIDGNIIFYKVTMLGAKLLKELLEEFIRTGSIIIKSNIPDYELEKGFYNKKPSIDDYRLNLKDKKPSKNYKFVNRVVRWGLPWIIMGNRVIPVKKAIEFHENKGYNYRIVFKNKYIEAYNKYGLIVLHESK